MEKATWEEIKALASDFKRTQATTLNQKLTERNCIDIINYLCTSQQLSLYFTTDGKTFLTPQELEKEIYEELEVAGNRIELTNLCKALDLDLYTIEITLNKMVPDDSDLHIVMGCLINSSYIRGLVMKTNEIIKDRGKISILELAQSFKLPRAFIEKMIATNLDSLIIQAHRDGDILYTNDFIRRYTCIIRGYLTRSSKPVLISYLSDKFAIPTKLVMKIVLELINLDHPRILGKIDQNKSTFIPDIYSRNQLLYLQRFYEQNNYLDYESMKKIGIQNPAKYVSTEFPALMNLSSCSIGDGITSQMIQATQECDTNSSYFNCYQIVPSVLSEVDLELLLVEIDKLVGESSSFMVMATEFVVSKKFLSKCVQLLDEDIKKKAEEFVSKNRKSIAKILSSDSGPGHNDSEESTKSGGSKTIRFKSGGGLTGREIKIKSVKNKYKVAATNRKQPTPTVDVNQTSLEFITEEEAVELFCTNKIFTSPENEEISPELARELFRALESQLNVNFRSQCQLVILQTSDTARNKTLHQELELRVSKMMNRITVFDHGLQQIDNDSLRSDLLRFNLKSLGGDLVDCLLEFVARDNDLEWTEASGAVNENRSKLIGQIKQNDLATALKLVIKSLKSCDEENSTFQTFQSVLVPVLELLGLLPKKLDKKSEKVLIQEIGAQYHSIIATKNETEQDIDSGELLLITLVLIFQKVTGYPLHASGKFVPAILEYLCRKSQRPDGMNGIDWPTLKAYQDYIIALKKMAVSASLEEQENFKQSHRDLYLKIIDIALNWKSIKNS